MNKPPILPVEKGLNGTCLPLGKPRRAHSTNPLSFLTLWVSRPLKRASFPDGSFVKRLVRKRDPVLWGCSVFGEAGELGMEGLDEKRAGKDDGSDLNGGEGESFSDSAGEEFRGSSSSSETSSSEEQRSQGRSVESLKLDLPTRNCSVFDAEKTHLDDGKMEKQKPLISDIEMMKERFSKLLLGEDMSGCGKGVCTALAISNAITNLFATIFGQIWRLEPLPPEKKTMWQREIECLLCVTDHIVELIPSWQTFPDGSKLEVMTCRPRSDLYINLPALRKLDNMLIEILDSFNGTEFWYVDQGIMAPDSDHSSSFRRPLQRQVEKWWLPVPRVPPGGLQEKSRKQLQHKRECTNQILKAAMAINSNSLSEMEIPHSYLESLPKNGRVTLGEVIHRYITSDQFSPECLLDCLDLSSEHQALEIANRVEASVFVWRRRANGKPINNANRTTTSWVKDFIVDAEKRELLADRAESLLICLKQRFPGLTQTALDMSKIQYNKDVGTSILESYSRVLESLAFNIVARIDDLLYVDDLTKHSDKFSAVPTVSVIARKSLSFPYSVPFSSTPYATAYATPSFSPAPKVSPARGERSPSINRKLHSRGLGVKKVLTDYIGVEVKDKTCDNVVEASESILNLNEESPPSQTCTGSS